MADKYSIAAVAKQIRNNYHNKGVHTFDTIPDDELVKVYTTRFPEYRDIVDWTGQSGMRASAEGEPSALAHPISFINTPGLGTGAKPGDWLIKALTGKNRNEFNESMSHPDFEEGRRNYKNEDTTFGYTNADLNAGGRAFGKGVTNKAADVVNSLTTPAAAALALLGIGAGGKVLPEAATTAAKALQSGVGAGVTASSGMDLADALPGALKLEPDAVEHALEAGSGLAGGMAMTGAGYPGLKKVVAPIDEARRLGKVGKGQATHELARKSLAQQLGTTDFETGAPSADALDHAALQRIVNGNGGVPNIVSDDPTGTLTRVGEGGQLEAAKQAEFVRSNYINQQPNAPIDVTPIRENLQAFMTAGLARNNPQLSGAISRALETGMMPAADAYNLKVEMNKYYKPGVLQGTSYLPQDALAVGNHLRGALGETFGPEFSAEDRMQGRIASIANDAEGAGHKASLVPVPSKLATIFEPSRTTYGTGAAAVGGAGVGGPQAGEYLGAVTLVKYLHDIYQNLQKYPEMHPDLAAAKALQDMQFSNDPYGARPEVPPELAINIRTPPPTGPISVGGAAGADQNARSASFVNGKKVFIGPNRGQNVSLTPRNEITPTITPDPRLSEMSPAGLDQLFEMRRNAAAANRGNEAFDADRAASDARTGLANSRMDVFEATSPRRTQLQLPPPAELGVARQTADYGPAPVQGGGVGVDPDTGATRGLAEPLPPAAGGTPMPKNAISASNMLRNDPALVRDLRHGPLNGIMGGADTSVQAPLSAEVPPPTEQVPNTLQRLIDAFTQNQNKAALEMERPLALVPTSTDVEDNPFHFLMPDAQVPNSGFGDTAPNPNRLIPAEAVPNSVPAPALPAILRGIGKP